MDNSLRAAAARIEITPSLDDVKRGEVFLKGYGHVKATAIRDKLFARILVLEAGSRRTAILSLDCAFSHEGDFYPFPGDAEKRIPATIPQGARGDWATALGSDKESVFVCATHTHYAPAISADSVRPITSKISALKSSLVPVTAKVGIGTSPLCRFRRPHLEKPVDLKDKPVDLTVSALILERQQAGEGTSPLACLVSYGVHPTLYADNSEITPEFVGLAMQQLEKSREKDDFVALFLQGFSGDLSPVFPTGIPRSDYKAITDFGGYLKGDVEITLSKAQPVPIASMVTAEEIIKPQPRPNYPHSPAITINGLRLGSIALLSCSAEVFFEYGAKIRKRAQARGFTHAILGGLVNGYSGYLPTHAAFHDGLGGYEMNITPYTDEVEKSFLDGVDRVLDRLKTGAPGFQQTS
jgi:hypothetical protein